MVEKTRIGVGTIVVAVVVVVEVDAGAEADVAGPIDFERNHHFVV